MLTLGVVKLKRPGERVQDALGNPAEVPTLKAAVVVNADPGKHGDFLPAEPGHAPVRAVGGQAGHAGPDLLWPGTGESRYGCPQAPP